MTTNSMNYHLSSGVKQFADGDTIHYRIEITRGTENNVDYWFVAYWVNGRGYDYTLFAGYGARHHIRYARGIDNAVISAKTHIDNRIDKIHPPSVWVCPKPAPVPSAIVPYTPQSPLQRFQAILDLLRHDTTLQKLCAVHDLQTSIRIECKQADRAQIEKAIAHLTDGITITWKLIPANTFTGQIAIVAKDAA